MMKQYLIVTAGEYDAERDTTEVLYWSNANGWASDLDLATVFDESEKELCSLPRDGKWIEVSQELGTV